MNNTKKDQENKSKKIKDDFEMSILDELLKEIKKSKKYKIDEDEVFLTVTEVHEKYFPGISRKTIVKMIKKGILPGISTGSGKKALYLIPKKKLLEALTKRLNWNQLNLNDKDNKIKSEGSK